MKTKSLLIPALVAVMLISLSACGQKSSSEASSQSSEQQPQVQTTAKESSKEEQTEPTEPSFDYLTALESNMTLEEKVGQMFLINYPDENAEGIISSCQPGGIVLFGKDFDGKTADEVKAMIQSCNASSKFSPLIAVDEEGGTVVRVSSNPNLYPSPFLSPKDYFKSGGMDAVIKAESDKADLLLSLGINVNLAPVCDVTKNEDSFMYSRSFSSDPNQVADFVSKTVDVYKSKQLGSVLKHFPGYGDNTDTHEQSATDNRSYPEFVNCDFIPFEAGINEGADAIMVSHNTITSIDPDYPASLSDKVHQIIRNDLNFKGVIMTDDLVMGAIGNYKGDENAAVLAVKGGNDILCGADYNTDYQAVIAAVNSGEIPVEQIDQSVIRILRWKQNLGILGF